MEDSKQTQNLQPEVQNDHNVGHNNDCAVEKVDELKEEAWSVRKGLQANLDYEEGQKEEVQHIEEVGGARTLLDLLVKRKLREDLNTKEDGHSQNHVCDGFVLDKVLGLLTAECKYSKFDSSSIYCLVVPLILEL